MFGSCLFCHSALGSNPLVEHLPIGRRLAFDPARGRLWVICSRCHYWNLTPFEERWEAIEESERLFARTSRVVSSGEIALAKVADRLTLIRIGLPTRGEFAAWRYGDRLIARRNARVLKLASGVLAGGTLAVAGAAAGISLGMLLYGYLYWGAIAQKDSPAVIATVPRLEGDSYLVARGDLRFISLLKPNTGSWRLLLGDELLVGSEAVMALGLTLPLINRFGARRRDVDEAVKLLASDDARTLIADAAGYNSTVRGLPRAMRVALEMAAHEDSERHAAAGELSLLKRAWRDAERVAAIADSLLIPPSVHNAWLRLRSRPEARGGV